MTFEEFKHDLQNDYGRINFRETLMLRRAYDAGRNQNLEEWKVLEKNYDDLYERTRWHFPAKGELPEDCSRVLAIEIERSECRAGLYDFLESEDGEGQWEWLPRKIAVLSNDQILAWQYLPEEPHDSLCIDCLKRRSCESVSIGDGYFVEKCVEYVEEIKNDSKEVN